LFELADPGTLIETKFSYSSLRSHIMQCHRLHRYRLIPIALGFAYIASPAWGQVIADDHKVIASDGAVDDHFGISIAIDNNIIVVGARFDDDNGTDSGSIYLFDAQSGNQITKLIPSDGATDDDFGFSVAIDQGLIAVGARLDDDHGNDSGSVYLFDALTGFQIAKIVPDDGSVNGQFGSAVSMNDGILAVGAPGVSDHGAFSGSAYLFDLATLTQIAKFSPDDGFQFDQFGLTIGISNGVVVVGSPFDDDLGDNSGSVYLYDTSGTMITKVHASDGSNGDTFGRAIAIDSGIVVIGAIADDVNGFLSGSAYLFTAAGSPFAKLLPDDGAETDFFGGSVDVSDGIVVIASPFSNNNGNNSGSAYLFDAYTATQLAKLIPSDGSAGQAFGQSIAISNGTVVVGASQDDDNGIGSGSAYVFDILCPADLNGDFSLDFFDISTFLFAFSAQDSVADFTGDGQFDFFDVSAFLAAFAAGCP
jgi:FG-GAP repeat